MVKDNPVIDLHSIDSDPTASPATAADGDPPNFELNANEVILEPRNPGSVTVMVTVKDVDGATTDAEFMVTVVAAGTNTGPVVGHTDATRGTESDLTATGVFPDLVGAVDTDDTNNNVQRLQIGGTARKVIDNANH